MVLAGPVRPEEGEDLAGSNFEVDAADGRDGALTAGVVLHKTLGQNGRAPLSFIATPAWLGSNDI